MELDSVSMACSALPRQIAEKISANGLTPITSPFTAAKMVRYALQQKNRQPTNATATGKRWLCSRRVCQIRRWRRGPGALLPALGCTTTLGTPGDNPNNGQKIMPEIDFFVLCVGSIPTPRLQRFFAVTCLL